MTKCSSEIIFLIVSCHLAYELLVLAKPMRRHVWHFTRTALTSSTSTAAAVNILFCQNFNSTWKNLGHYVASQRWVLFWLLFFFLKLILAPVSSDRLIGSRFTSVPQFCFKSVMAFVKVEIKHFFFFLNKMSGVVLFKHVCLAHWSLDKHRMDWNTLYFIHPVFLWCHMKTFIADYLH